MRTMALVAATAGVLFAAMYFFGRSRPEIRAEPARPLTFAEIQQRREEQQTTPKPVRRSVVTTISTRVASTEPIGHLADAKEQLSRSMVGRPFQMSESVDANCRRHPSWPCDELGEFLERMRTEPRDPVWAPQIEQYIVRSIAVEEEGALTIRALECRSTRCAIEVASEAQFGIQKSWNEKGLDVRSSYFSAFADESDSKTGLVTQIVVHTWRRRSAGDED